MRVLYIAFPFPPFDLIGAHRTGKIAKYLHMQGSDLRVISAADQKAPHGMPVEIPAELIQYVSWQDVDNIRVWLRRIAASDQVSSVTSGGYTVSQAPVDAKDTTWRSWLRSHFYAALYLPDRQVGWLMPAIRAGRAIIDSGWRPDVILASAQPFSGLIVARILARQYGIPWVAELRDLWAGHRYNGLPAWRQALNGLMQRVTLATAAQIVTVSEGLQDILMRQTGRNVHVVYNGFDEEDYRGLNGAPLSGTILKLVYTGTYYDHVYSAAPLLEAMRAPDLRGKVVIDFYVRGGGATLRAEVVRHDLQEQVRFHTPVPSPDVPPIQAQADISLLLLPKGEAAHGVLTGKIFGYFAARRPILCLSQPDASAAVFLRERQAGVVANTATGVAAALREWLRQKQANGVPPIPASAMTGLTRREQAQAIYEILLKAAKEDARSR